MNVTTKLHGFKEVDKTLGQLPKATGKRILRKTGVDALEITAKEMRSRAPERDGELKEGIGVGTKLTRSQRRYAGFNGGPRDPHMVVVHAGPGAHPQAITQEIGTHFHAAQPYAEPAWDMTKLAVLDYVAGTLGDVVMKAAAKAKKKGTLRVR